jgi:hypothetical protein
MLFAIFRGQSYSLEFIPLTRREFVYRFGKMPEIYTKTAKGSKEGNAYLCELCVLGVKNAGPQLADSSVATP